MMPPIFQIPLYTQVLSIAIPAGATLVIFTYSLILWLIGDRVGAKNYIFMGISVTLTMIAIGGAYIISNMVASSIAGERIDVGEAWSKLYNPNLSLDEQINMTAAGKFHYIYRKAVDWIVYLGVTQAAWGLIPYIGYAISEALRSATLWQNWVFSITSTTFLGLTWFTMILYYIHPWLLAFGAGLASTPRFQTMGGVLLSIYLVTGVSTVLIANFSYQYLSQYIEYVEKAPDASDPLGAAFGGFLSIASIAGDADNAAQGFMYATITAIIGTLLMGIVTAGTSRIFGGIPILFRPL